MTWYFDPSGTTLTSVEYTDGQGNTYTVASNVPYSSSWSGAAPDEAVAQAIDWVIEKASDGNTQTAVTALAELLDSRWQEGTA